MHVYSQQPDFSLFQDIPLPPGVKVNLDVSRVSKGLYLVIGRQGGKMVVSSRLVVIE